METPPDWSLNVAVEGMHERGLSGSQWGVPL